MLSFLTLQHLLSTKPLPSVLAEAEISSLMASKSIFTFVIVLVLLCNLFLMRETNCDCNTACGCLGDNAAGPKKILNRKVFSVLKNKQKTTLKARLEGSSNGEKSVSWELRKVPSGPDPLHHNGGSPKPETP